MAGNPLPKLIYDDQERRTLIRVKTKMLNHADEITEKLMDLVRQGDTTALKIAASYSMGTPAKQRNTVDLPELVGVSPLKKAKIISDYVAQGRLTISEGNQLMSMLSTETEMLSLQTISTFLKRLESEPAHLVAKEMLPALRMLDTHTEPLVASENVIDPTIPDFLK
jgi:hypothetical protein